MPLYELKGQSPRRKGSDPAWVAPSADLIGEVLLGERASIWFGAVLRADNTPIAIGNGSNIQDGAILHSDPGSPLTIGDDVTVGHRAILHGCTIGDRVLVGMGATILNGVVIADDSLVGAGALVTEGKRFPPRSLIVGVPAQVKRSLTDAEVAGLREGAEEYQRKALIYGTHLEVSSR
jgi:carbonic anhydrase/acetyltransferase-like protein (isoleucine patch superfamily)